LNKTPKNATSLAGDIAEKKEPLEHIELIEPFEQIIF
jgi:hypothetical protein